MIQSKQIYLYNAIQIQAFIYNVALKLQFSKSDQLK